MPKKNEYGKCFPKMPEEVLDLINRKLGLLRKKQKRRWVDAQIVAYSRFDREISENLIAGIFGALNAVPESVYREIVSNANAITREWPGVVWKAIVSILEKVQGGPVDANELNDIVDEHVWRIGQLPFTFDYIDVDKFRASVRRMFARRGRRIPPSFDPTMSLDATKGRVLISTTARHEREAIGIVIDEYVIVQRKNISAATSQPSPSSSIRREARKLDTKAMYKSWQKSYQSLKGKHPNMSDVWYSQQIAKKDIAHGRNAVTIKKQMKK
ncbi:MAG: hypothetical protein ACOY4W_00780 [Thermodesulfobacteriota bacterium]